MRIHEILTSEVGKGGYVRLYRRRPMEAEYKQLTGALSLENFSVDWVLNTYGGGEYRVRAFSDKNLLIKQLNWAVDPSIPMKTPEATPPGPAAPQDLAALIRASKEGGERGAAGDGGSSNLLIAELMRQNTALVTAIATRPAAGGEDSALLKILLPRLLDKRETTPIDDMMKFASFLERAKKGGDLEEKEEKSPLEAIVERVLGAVVPILEKRFVNNGAPAVPAIPAGASPAKPPAKPAQTAQPPTSENAEMQILLNRFRSAVLHAAAENKDPYQWAESMFAFVPTDYHTQIFAFANSDDWFAQLFSTANGEAAKHIEYLQAVRGSILAIGFTNATIQAKSKTPPATPEEWAKEFVNWTCPSYRKEFSELVRDDPEFFPDIFGEQYEPNRIWLEKLKAAIVDATKPAAPAQG
jgi:hypothetical protein